MCRESHIAGKSGAHLSDEVVLAQQHKLTAPMSLTRSWVCAVLTRHALDRYSGQEACPERPLHSCAGSQGAGAVVSPAHTHCSTCPDLGLGGTFTRNCCSLHQGRPPGQES